MDVGTYAQISKVDLNVNAQEMDFKLDQMAKVVKVEELLMFSF